MSSIRRAVTYAGAVSEALKKHSARVDVIGAERSLASLLPGERVRIFDGNDERQVDMTAAVDFFASDITHHFGKQMTGKKPIEVNRQSVAALLDIIHYAAEKFIFTDIVISVELDKVKDPIVRAQCKRDLTVAFANTALGKVNTDAAVSALLEPHTKEYLNASSYRAFCLAVIGCNNMEPEDALRTIQEGARTIMKNGMMTQLGIVKNDDGSFKIPDYVADKIKSFDYDELLKNGVVAKNIPLLQDGSDSTLKHIMRDVIAHVYRELRRQDGERAKAFLEQFNKKTREYVDAQMSIRFASASEPTQGVFGISVAAKAAASASSSSTSSVSTPLKKDKEKDSPRSRTQRVTTPRKASFFAEEAASLDVQELKDEKRPMERERADSARTTHQKLKK